MNKLWDGIKMKCVYNINKRIYPIQECGKEAKWEVRYDSMIDGCEHSAFFCDEHLENLKECGNSTEYRKVGTDNWIEIIL